MGELEDVSLVANQFLLLVIVELYLVFLDELLEKGNGECREFLANDIILGGDFESGEGTLDVEFLIVKGDEFLIDLTAAATVG